MGRKGWREASIWGLIGKWMGGWAEQWKNKFGARRWREGWKGE